MTRRVAGRSLAVATCIVVWHGVARAEDDAACGAGRPWVLLQGSTFEGAARERFIAQLRAALDARDLDLCVGEDPRRAAAVAVVETSPTHGDAVSITVEVRDAITAKRVARELALGTMPADGRPLTVALAADELLRASWEELAMHDAPPPARPVPDQIERLVEAPRAPADVSGGRAFELGAAGAVEHHGGGVDQVGADLALAYWLWPRFGVDARIGLRSVLPQSAPDGRVRGSAFVAALGPSFALLPRADRAGVDLAVRVAVTRVAFVAEPATGGGAREDGAAAVHLLGGARGWLRIVPALVSFAEVGIGAPVRSVRADDGTQAVMGMSGIRLSASIGVMGAP